MTSAYELRAGDVIALAADDVRQISYIYSSGVDQYAFMNVTWADGRTSLVLPSAHLTRLWSADPDASLDIPSQALLSPPATPGTP